MKLNSLVQVALVGQAVLNSPHFTCPINRRHITCEVRVKLPGLHGLDERDTPPLHITALVGGTYLIHIAGLPTLGKDVVGVLPKSRRGSCSFIVSDTIS